MHGPQSEQKWLRQIPSSTSQLETARQGAESSQYNTQKHAETIYLRSLQPNFLLKT